MAKSHIIKDTIEGNVTLETSLNRLFVLAIEKNEQELASWAEKELNGYSSTDALPNYRRVTGLLLQYSGINGNFQVKNQPLQPGLITAEHRNMIEQSGISDGIRYISELASADSPAERDLSMLAGDILKNSRGRIQCVSIKQVLSQSVFQNICSNVKHKTLQALVDLEHEYGNLDTWGINDSEKEQKPSKADEFQKNSSISKNAVVAMRFDDETKPLREAIRKGIEAAGYNAIFIDEVQHNDFITPELLKNIQECRFVVAELSHQNNGAYFEEGYAMGMGKPVIQLCKKGIGLHFDIAQKNTIKWTKEDDIPDCLTNRIKATIK